MNLDHIIPARNASYENMLTAQAMMDFAQTEQEKVIAESLYRMNWAAYSLLVELEKLEKKKQRQAAPQPEPAQP